MDSHQWRYVNSSGNPSDHATRGIHMSESAKVKHWFQGPEFLWKSTQDWGETKVIAIPEDDVEIKKSITVRLTTVDNIPPDILPILQGRISCWKSLIRVIAPVLKFISKLKWLSTRNSLSLEDLKQSEQTVYKLLQEKYLSHEFVILKEITNFNRSQRKGSLKKTSSLMWLDPFIDVNDGLIRVGGRL